MYSEPLEAYKHYGPSTCIKNLQATIRTLRKNNTDTPSTNNNNTNYNNNDSTHPPISTVNVEEGGVRVTIGQKHPGLKLSTGKEGGGGV